MSNERNERDENNQSSERRMVRLEIIGDREDVQDAMHQMSHTFGDRVTLTVPRGGLKADGFVSYGVLRVDDHEQDQGPHDTDGGLQKRCCAELVKTLNALQTHVRSAVARLQEEQQQANKATSNMNMAVFELHTRNAQALESTLRISCYTLGKMLDVMREAIGEQA